MENTLPLQQLLTRTAEAVPDEAQKSAARELVLTALLDLAQGPVHAQTLLAPKTVLRQELKSNGGSAQRMGVSPYRKKGIVEYTTASQNQTIAINTAFNTTERFREAVLAKLEGDLGALGMPESKAKELALDTEQLNVGTNLRQEMHKPSRLARQS